MARGFTLVEVLLAMVIMAFAISALQITANGALKSTVETNRQRVAKMLLLKKAEEVIAGLEEGSGGGFEGYPGYEWTVAETAVPIGETEESVLQITVGVTYPTLSSGGGGGLDDFESDQPRDGPGQIRITVLIDPPDAELQPGP
ncbi:prepilin-type N-terminal cleavage/methylation domain-containing protein [Planctomycetota bacterium]